MPATLNLFRKSAEDTWQADAATLPMSKPVVVETTDSHDLPILQDNGMKMAPDYKFVRSNN